MYKMIAIDVDDTLLNDAGVVTEATRKALDEAVAQGVMVTLATGRMFASAKQIAAQIGINVPLITYQGSLVKNLLDECVLYERSVPESALRILFAYSERKGLHLQMYYNDALYAKEDNEKVREYSRMSNVPYTIEPDLSSFLAKPITKLLFFDEPDYLDELAVELKELLHNEEVHITKSKPFFLEILHREGTKGHAVKYLADHFGCNMNEVIAIGDSWNDREMLEIAGLGVAMGNAVPALKEIADHITASNEEDGVKQVIERFILGTRPA